MCAERTCAAHPASRLTRVCAHATHRRASRATRPAQLILAMWSFEALDPANDSNKHAQDNAGSHRELVRPRIGPTLRMLLLARARTAFASGLSICLQGTARMFVTPLPPSHARSLKATTGQAAT